MNSICLYLKYNANRGNGWVTLEEMHEHLVNEKLQFEFIDDMNLMNQSQMILAGENFIEEDIINETACIRITPDGISKYKLFSDTFINR